MSKADISEVTPISGGEFGRVVRGIAGTVRRPLADAPGETSLPPGNPSRCCGIPPSVIADIIVSCPALVYR